jgi:hypothetical protein
MLQLIICIMRGLLRAAMLARFSKCLALIMALCLMGFSGAPVQALCPAPCCNAISSASEPVNKLAYHGNQSHGLPKSSPPCLLKGNQPLDFAASGPTSDLSDNHHLSGAYHAFTPVELAAAVRVSAASEADAALPILYLNQPIYLISLSLLC